MSLEYKQFLRNAALTEIKRLHALLRSNEKEMFKKCLPPGQALEDCTDRRLEDLYDLLRRSLLDRVP